MRTIIRSSAAVAAITLVFVIVGGCGSIGGPTVTYFHEPQFSLPESKTYQWSEARSTHGQDSLLEANVRFLAGRELEAKGLTSRSEKAALIVWMDYEFRPDIYGYGYELRGLTLNVSRPDGKQLVWRGVATGAIKTDAASGELKKAVEGILAHFPPK